MCQALTTSNVKDTVITMLNDIKSPADIRAMSDDALRILADEIREKIISVVSENGGHLASNLG